MCVCVCVCVCVCESNNKKREVVSDDDNFDSQTHDNEEDIVKLDDDSTFDKNIYDPS